MSRQSSSTPPRGRDFIRQIVADDVASGAHGGKVVTRFPPEPNGFLHIGHAKSIVLNFGIADEYEGGRCHLRFDDTNPTTEDLRYVEAIQEDVKWLGFDWGEHLHFASDSFDEMYGFAVELIEKGLAYVDSQSEEEARESRGTVTQPGRGSPYRDRSVEESLDLFRRMRAGEFPDGSHVLRARIDMASPNMLMRDPVLYRIRHAHHYRTGDAWCIYPMYDFAHPLEDALEGVTHSLCTLEFENNRELYDWVVENTSVPSRPRQYEFARLNLDYTVLSKRRLGLLVRKGDVDGWDDPRMPTIAGLRRRGFTPEAIRTFCEMIGVAKADARVDMGKLEYTIRDDLNPKVPRVLCVENPLRVVITSWPEEEEDWLEAPYYPRDLPQEGSRLLPFSRTLYIERDDFRTEPTPGFRRLVPGGEVRLRYGYIIRCDEVIRDDAGEVVELRCSHDPGSRGGSAPDGRKVKGTIHWVSARHALACELRLYDRLFLVPDPEAGGNSEGEESEEGEAAVDERFRRHLNPESLVTRKGWVEPSVAQDPAGTRYQFERLGYFWRDPQVADEEKLVFNRIVTLRDRWAKMERQRKSGATAEPGKAPSGKAAADDGSSQAPGQEEKPSQERPELPPEVRRRVTALVETFGIPEVEGEILAREGEVEVFYREAVAASDLDDAPRLVANWMIHELPAVHGDRRVDQTFLTSQGLARLVELVESGVISSRGGKELLQTLVEKGGDPDRWVQELNLAQVSDREQLKPAVDEVLRAHPDKVEEFRSGRTGLLGFFMGRLMARTEGKADPEVAKGLLLDTLNRES